MAFLELCMKLKNAQVIEKSSEALEREETFAKRIERAHIAIQFGCLILFCVYMGYLFTYAAEGAESARGITNFVILEITCWGLGTVSSIVLIWAILYTVYYLRILYPGQDFSETNRILWIAVIFFISMVTKSAFQWTMYIYHEE